MIVLQLVSLDQDNRNTMNIYFFLFTMSYTYVQMYSMEPYHHPIHIAVTRAEKTNATNFGNIKEILDSKADINVTNIAGNAPLHLSVGNASLVQFLLEHRASPNAKNKLDYTPLHWASQANNKESVALLIASGADILAVTKDGKTILDLNPSILNS